MVQDEIRRKKSGTRETPTLLTIADVRIDTMKSPLFDTFTPVPRITCHVSFSLMITATSTDPTLITPPLSFSRLRYRKVAPKTHNN